MKTRRERYLSEWTREVADVACAAGNRRRPARGDGGRRGSEHRATRAAGASSLSCDSREGAGPRAGRRGRSTGEGPPDFRLSEGQAPADAPALVARPPAVRLSQAEADRVLDRLPALAAEPRALPFALREPSLPPPRAGRTERVSFPPPPGDAARPDAGAAGPLSVLRRMPEGDVPLAPHLSVTFSQPMLALDSHAALALADLPLRLEPQPPGEWRWVGTRTLVFEPEGRFPMASAFRATIPAGTRSASGASLGRAESWSFTTPAPRLLARHPEGGPARRDTLLFAAFDQRIDKTAVLAATRLRAGSRGATRAAARDGRRAAGGRDRRADAAGGRAGTGASRSAPRLPCRRTRRWR